MKNTLFGLLAICLLSLPSRTFSQQLTFSYDAAGNQTERKWVCVNCTNSNSSNAAMESAPLKLAVKVLDTVKKVTVNRNIIASPNPLVETLNVNWQTEVGVSVKSIMVFNINGIRTHELNPKPNQSSVTLPFQHLATGTYILYVTFSDQRKESIKVIKK